MGSTWLQQDGLQQDGLQSQPQLPGTEPGRSGAPAVGASSSEDTSPAPGLRPRAPLRQHRSANLFPSKSNWKLSEDKKIMNK